jgi:phage repressor protein C with HTH and peptisase S24 domain
LETGSVDQLVEKVTHHVAEGIRQRFAKANEAKAHQGRSVSEGREFVESYVQFVHYVENLHKAVAGHGGHHDEGQGADEHQH